MNTRNPDMMSKVEAIFVLADMSRSRKLTLEQVTALQMGVRCLCKRHFDHMRGLVRWRERKAKEAAVYITPPFAVAAAEAAAPEVNDPTVQRSNDQTEGGEG